MSNAFINYTEFFKEEKPVYVSNVSNCQVSVLFNIGPNQSESYLFVNTKDPIDLTRYIPFHAIKSSMDFRRMLNRAPPALRIINETEYRNHYEAKATAENLSSLDEAVQKVEEKIAKVHNRVPLDNAPTPVKLHEVVEDGKYLGEKKIVRSIDGQVSEDEVINPRVLNICLQVHPQVPEQQRASAQQVLAELDEINGLTLADYEYIQGHGMYKSVKNFAKEHMKKMLNESSVDDEKPAKSKKK